MIDGSRHPEISTLLGFELDPDCFWCFAVENHVTSITRKMSENESASTAAPAPALAQVVARGQLKQQHASAQDGK